MTGREPPDSGNSFADIVNIIRTLRSPGGCPWDMKQTIETAVEDLLSEAEALNKPLWLSIPFLLSV